MGRRILIAGYYGFRNAGDEAILAVLVDALRGADPAVEISVVSGDPLLTGARHRVSAIPASDLMSLIEVASQSGLIVLGGGGLFQDYWGLGGAPSLAPGQAGLALYGSLPLLGALSSVPVVIHAAGVGPLVGAEGVDVTCRAFLLASRASVRDGASRDLLVSLGIRARRLGVTPDPAFALRPNDHAAEAILAGLPLSRAEPILGVCLRHWEIGVRPEEWQAEIAAALDGFLAGHLCSLLFVPFQTLGGMPLTDDSAAARAVVARMRHGDRAVLLEADPPPEALAALLARCDLILGMRYHSLVFGAIGRVPLVGLAYDPKVTQLMQQLGLADHCLDLASIKRRVLLSALTRAWDERCALRSALARRLPGIIRRARSGLRELAAAQTFVSSRRGLGAETAWLRDLTLRQTRLLAAEAAEKRRAFAAAERRESELLVLAEGKDGEIRRLREQIEESERRDAEVRGRLEAVISQLQSIHDSRGWRLLLAAWRARLTLAPRGSRRERLARWAWRALRSIARSPRQFSAAMQHRLARSARWLARPRPPFDDRFDLPDHSQVTLFTDDPALFPDHAPRQALSGHSVGSPQKVSLIATVKDEAETARGWIRCIQAQTRLPDEIVVVDGGSVDGTARLLEEAAAASRIPMRVLKAAGANPARARNLAIAEASHPLLAVTDFGCLPEPDWLEKLILPFELQPGVQVSCGFYEPADPTGRSLKDAGAWAGLDRLDPEGFLPSSRSVAFTREAVAAAGGHPEWLTRTGDDTYLDLCLKHLGGPWAFVPAARVRWLAPDTPRRHWQKLRAWAAGDGEAGIHGRYYWHYLLRLLAGGGGLALAAGAVAIAAAHSGHPLLLAGSAVGLGAVGGVLILRSAGLPIPGAAYRALGEAAQVSGFLSGSRRRALADVRRRASLKGTILILSGVPIDDSGGGARSTQWATEFLRQGYGVVFVHRFGRDESRDLGLRFSHPDLVAVSLASFDWDLIARRNPGLLDGPRLTGLVEFPLADFLTTIGRMRRDGHPVVYDLLDDWRTSLGGRWYAPEVEREIASAAQVLAATTPGLQERLRELGGGRDVALLPNAVNARLFDPRSVHPRPADLPEAERTLVYIGALWGSWFDWDLIREVALRRPRARVVVIGDCRRPPPSPPSNLDFLGLKPQRDLPAYLSHADACILPWKVDAITRSTSPLKVYECLAMGLPAVAPRLGPLEGMPGVFLADSAAEFVRLAGEARLGPAEREAAAAFVRLNTWSARLEQLMRLVEAVRI